MIQPWSLVTPASRGIGLQLARRILKTTSLPVVATARSKLDETKGKILEGLDVDEKRLDVLELDVKDESTVSAAASFCSEKFPTSPSSSSASYLHLAFCLPGILTPEKSPSQIDASSALEMLRVNTLGPLLLTKHFTPFLPTKRTELAPTSSSSDSLPPSAVFVLMAARVGSITDNKLGGWYTYRASKAAVMQLAKTANVHVRMSSGGKAGVVALHPGTVKTELSREFWGNVKEEKLFSAEFAAERLMEVVGKLGQEEGGRCWDWKGEEIKP